MDKLNSSNLSSYVELPVIAVMGDTSSGKSTLLSSVALVELPSSSELTTRCPIELNMSKGNIRSAKISIKWREPKSSESKQKKRKLFDSKIVSNEQWGTLSSVISDAQESIMSQSSGKGICVNIYNCVR
jgi:ABC-type antimicrobial peptide transport system ATPase subunit